MYIKLNNGVIEKYPYSIGDLRKDNPQTSFPKAPNNEMLAEWQVFPVQAVSQPPLDHTKTVKEGIPIYAGGWKQTWVVESASPQEIDQRIQSHNEARKSARATAYREEADVLFFKAQRGEATMEAWLSLVQDIKNRFPDL
jgi:hypothetical protein